MARIRTHSAIERAELVTPRLQVRAINFYPDFRTPGSTGGGFNGGLKMWVGKRAADKETAPGKLDHIVAGGQPFGLGVRENLIKEAWEEAGIPAELAARAAATGAVSYRCERPEGLRDDVMFCYDLELPADFTPVNTDGEVESFALWPIEEVLARVRDTEDFKFNVNLVVIDLAIRLGLIAPDDTGYQEIWQGLRLVE